MSVKIATRGVQKFGGSLYLNIPSEWAKDNKVVKDDDLDIHKNEDGSLVIKPPTKVEATH